MRTYTVRYFPKFSYWSRGLVTENSKFIRRVKEYIPISGLIFTTIGLTAFGLIRLVKKEVKESIKPLETKIDMMNIMIDNNNEMINRANDYKVA